MATAMTIAKERVCVIGAGPSGMSVLYHFAKLREEGRTIPEVVCFEKQDNWGGLWNFKWDTGKDQNGELHHGSMYYHMWRNAPKECLEFPDYTFEQHFGRAIPSYPPREVLRNYLEGRWKTKTLRDFIRFHSRVTSVQYSQSSDDFVVNVLDLASNDEFKPERFTHVLVAVGMFSFPNIPTIKGNDTFPGRELHSHDFRNAENFSGQRLLIVGASYTAEDLALQCLKYGAKHIICTWRTKPMGFNWPNGIEERPLLEEIKNETVIFKDGTSAEVDCIIFCTGYNYNFPFLPTELRLDCQSSIYPPDLYKGTIWMKGGNYKLMYLGCHKQIYTFTMFDVQAQWACKVILGDISLPSHEAMLEDITYWQNRKEKLQNVHDKIDFQTKFVQDLSSQLDLKYDLDVSELFHQWQQHKMEDIAEYRNHQFTSKFTGTKSPRNPVPFMNDFDDSIETFVYKTTV